MRSASRMRSVCVPLLAVTLAICCNAASLAAAEPPSPTSYVFLIDASSKVDSEAFTQLRMDVLRYVAVVPRAGDHLMVFAFGQDVRLVLDEPLPEKPARRGLLKELNQIQQVDTASLGPSAVEIVARQVRRHKEAHPDHRCRLYMLLSGEADSPTGLYRRTTDYDQIVDICRKAFKQDDLRVWMAPLTKLSSSLERLRQAIGADIPGNPAPSDRLLPPYIRLDDKTLSFGELTVDEKPVAKRVALALENIYGADGLELEVELKPKALPADIQLSLMTDKVSCPEKKGEVGLRLAAGGEGAGGDVTGTIEFSSAVPQADIVPTSVPFAAKVRVMPPEIELAPEQLAFGDVSKPADGAPPSKAQDEITIASLHKARGLKLQIVPTLNGGRLPQGVSIQPTTIDCREEGQKEKFTLSVGANVRPGDYRGALRISTDHPRAVVKPTVLPYTFTVKKLPAVTIEPERIDFGDHDYERQIEFSKVITVKRPPDIEGLELTLVPAIEKLTGGKIAEEKSLTVDLDARRKQFRVPLTINDIGTDGCEVQGKIIARLNTDKVALEPAEIPIQATVRKKVVPPEPELAFAPDRLTFPPVKKPEEPAIFHTSEEMVTIAKFEGVEKGVPVELSVDWSGNGPSKHAIKPERVTCTRKGQRIPVSLYFGEDTKVGQYRGTIVLSTDQDVKLSGNRIGFSVAVKDDPPPPPPPEVRKIVLSDQVDFGKVSPSPGQPATALGGLRVENIEGGTEGTRLKLDFDWSNKPAGITIRPSQTTVTCPEAGRSIKVELAVSTETALEESFDLAGTVRISALDKSVKVNPTQVGTEMTIRPPGANLVAKIVILAAILAVVFLTLGFFFKKPIIVESASGTGEQIVDAFYWPFPAMASLEDVGYQGAIRYKQSGVQLRRAKGQTTEDIGFGQTVELTNAEGNTEAVRFRLESGDEEGMGTPEEPETL